MRIPFYKRVLLLLEFNLKFIHLVVLGYIVRTIRIMFLDLPELEKAQEDTNVS